jgi:hypothetical protein
LLVLCTIKIILYIEYTASKEAFMADLPVSNTSVSDASHTMGLRQVRAEAEGTAHLSVVWILLQPVT